MATYIALLRGINLGGRNRVAMADLRELFEVLGHRDVRTYIQSGNVVFTSGRVDADGIASELTQRIDEELGVSATTVVLSEEELVTAATANPYVEEAEYDPTKVHVAFMSSRPEDPTVLTSGMDAHAPEELSLGDRVLYLHLPDGIGRSQLVADLQRRPTETELTIRNWRTVTKLLEMTGDPAP